MYNFDSELSEMSDCKINFNLNELYDTHTAVHKI